MSAGSRWYQNEKLSVIQVAALVIPVVATTAALFLPRAQIDFAGRDAWTVPLAGAVYGLAVCAAVVALHRRHPGKSLTLIAAEVAGPAGRIAYGLLYAWFALFVAALTARQMGDFFIFAMLPSTPMSVTVALMVFTAAWALRGGPETLGRLVIPLTAVIFCTVAILIGLSTGSMELDHLLPLASAPPESYLRAVIITTFPYGELIFLSWYLPHISPRRVDVRWLFGGVILAALSLVVQLVAVIAVFGVDLVLEATAPIFELIRFASVGTFLDRLDVFFLSGWQVAFFLKLCYLLYPAAVNLAETFRLADYRSLIYPTALITVVLAELLFPSLRDVTSFLRGPLIPYGLLMQGLLPLLLLILATLRAARRPGERAGGDST